MGAGCGAEPVEPRRPVRALHDLLVQLGAGQDRQDLGRPPGQVIVTPGLAGAALAQVPYHGQPKGSGQHRDLRRGAVGRIAVAVSVGQQLPQVPASEIIPAWLVTAVFHDRERGDLEGAQYRLPVLAPQPPDLGYVAAEFPCRAPAVQAARHEQVEEPLPGFWQRGRDLLEPVLQRRASGRRIMRCRNIGSGVSAHRVDEDVAGGGDRRVRIRPQPLGAAAEHRVTMLADHVGEHRRAFPLTRAQPEPLPESGIGPPLVACGYRRHPRS